MPKNKTEVFVPSDKVMRTATLEQALGIDSKRFRELGFVMDDIWAKSRKKADALNAIAGREDLTPIEKTYMGFKVYERICKWKIPLWGELEKML